MILTTELRAEIARQGLSQRKMAKMLGISEKTFYEKMKKGIFLSNEMEDMIHILNLKNPAEIFFAHSVT